MEVCTKFNKEQVALWPLEGDRKHILNTWSMI